MKLLYAIEDAIGRITLSNPPGNALTTPVFADAGELAAFLAAPDLRGVVVAGDGRHFCAGADPDTMKRDVSDERADLPERLNEGKALLDILANATVPTAAAIRGNCLGAGLEIALSCDFRFASANAMLGFPETTLGVLPGLGGTVRLPSVVRNGAAVDLILSGRMVRGDEALELGLVDRVANTKQVESGAAAYLLSLTEHREPALVRAVMEAIRNASRLPAQDALRRETELFWQVARTSVDGGGDG